MVGLRSLHDHEPEPVCVGATVLVARRVIPGREDDFRAWDRRIRAAAAAHAGFLGWDGFGS